MSTLADFYVNKKWLGSLSSDGYPSAVLSHLQHAKTPSQFRKAVKKLLTDLAYADDPQGESDRVTIAKGPQPDTNPDAYVDYTYVFTDKLHVYSFAKPWDPSQGD